MQKSSKIALVISIILFIFYAYYALDVHMSIKHLRADLSERGIITNGVIYEKKAGYKSKVSFYYIFNVNDINYRGYFNNYSSNFQIGDTIQLKYDPLDPTRNEKIKPPSITSTTKGKLIVAAIFVVPVIFILLYVRFIFKKYPNG